MLKKENLVKHTVIMTKSNRKGKRNIYCNVFILDWQLDNQYFHF